MSSISGFLDPVRLADLAADTLYLPAGPDVPGKPRLFVGNGLQAAERAYAALHAALAARGPRFAQTYCSQCGCECGPGDSGISSCIEHIRKQRPQRTHPCNPCTPGVSYAEFRSEFMACDVRIGYEWQNAEDHAHFPQLAGAELIEVWIGTADLGQHLMQTTADVLAAELRDHLRSAPQ